MLYTKSDLFRFMKYRTKYILAGLIGAGIAILGFYIAAITYYFYFRGY